MIRAAAVVRMIDSLPSCFRIYCCARAVASSVFTQPGPSADETAGPADAQLADTLVLDAVWLSRAFVQVLEDMPTRDSGGMLDHGRFPNI